MRKNLTTAAASKKFKKGVVSKLNKTKKQKERIFIL